jgi:hypothetical protein
MTTRAGDRAGGDRERGGDRPERRHQQPRDHRAADPRRVVRHRVQAVRAVTLGARHQVAQQPGQPAGDQRCAAAIGHRDHQHQALDSSAAMVARARGRAGASERFAVLVARDLPLPETAKDARVLASGAGFADAAVTVLPSVIMTVAGKPLAGGLAAG